MKLSSDISPDGDMIYRADARHDILLLRRNMICYPFLYARRRISSPKGISYAKHISSVPAGTDIIERSVICPVYKLRFFHGGDDKARKIASGGLAHVSEASLVTLGIS